MIFVTVSNLLGDISDDLMFTLYGRENGELKHRGLFALSDEKSRADLLSRFGDASVAKHEANKGYVMVYLDE